MVKKNNCTRSWRNTILQKVGRHSYECWWKNVTLGMVEEDLIVEHTFQNFHAEKYVANIINKKFKESLFNVLGPFKMAVSYKEYISPKPEKIL